MINKPFVSFIVMSYKAEKFIQEAIDGALAQTYDNMEIIFSDDASPDKTFEIIEQNIKKYSGKHKEHIRIIRNEKNMGLGAHLNKLWWQEAKGDWIVVSAGDDVSLPNRVERLMEFAKEDIGVIHHRSHIIDEKSNIIPYPQNHSYDDNQVILDTGTTELVIEKNVYLLGQSMCINKKMLDIFGPFHPNVVNEDVVLAYRARHFGRVILLDEKLLRYRVHTESINYNLNILEKNKYSNYVKSRYKNALNDLAILNQIEADNNILNLSNDLLIKLTVKKYLNNMTLFLYGDGNFNLTFLFKRVFYKMVFQRMVLKQYLYLKNKMDLRKKF